jgi:hypothetical protein
MEQQLDTKIEIIGLQAVVRELNKFDKSLIPRLRNRMRSATEEDRAKVVRVIQETTPLLQQARNTGFFHFGRSAWNEATVDIDRISGGKNLLIAIKATGRNKKFGFDYAELAGINAPRIGGVSRTFTRVNSSKNNIVTAQNGQGAAFVKMLNNHLPANHTAKPGRYAFQALVRRMPYIQKKIIRIIQEFGEETSTYITQKDN